ncbi:MAG: hypothetical protein AADX96_24285 [Thiocapsa sp. C3-sup]
MTDRDPRHHPEPDQDRQHGGDPCGQKKRPEAERKDSDAPFPVGA